MKRSIAFGVCAVSLSIPGYAQQPQAPTAAKVDWVKGVVVTDGGSVYTEPDFDAKVADYLSVKTPIFASRTAVAGKGGLGLFHRIRYQNKLGYMADVDIRITDIVENPAETRPNIPANNKKQSKKVKSKAFAEEGEETGRKAEPFFFTRQIGPTLGMVNFTEKFEDHTMRSSMWMLGLRLVGPGVLFDGPPLDFNVMLSPMAPGYYKAFTKSVSGFMTMGDLGLTLPFVEESDWMVTYSLGLMWVYTNYKVQISNSKFDSQEFRMGVDAGISGAYRFGPKKMFSMRVDGKYYFEKTRYYGFLTSFLTEY